MKPIIVFLAILGAIVSSRSDFYFFEHIDPNFTEHDMINLFTSDLDNLFSLKEPYLSEKLQELEYNFQEKKSVRAGTLLSFFYLFGTYDNSARTKDWMKSADILKQIFHELDEEETRNSNHRSLLLFLAIQNELIDDFGYFDQEISQQFLNPYFMSGLVSEILNDYVSRTNQAIMVSNFHLCQQFKKYLVSNETDFNQIWRSVGLGIQSLNDVVPNLKHILLGQIPIIDQCNLNECSRKLQEVAYLQSRMALDYLHEEVGYYDDLTTDPDELNLDAESQQFIQQGIDANEEIVMLNDMAQNGNAHAGLSLFNLYFQGNPALGVNRDVQAAENYLEPIYNHIDTNGFDGLDPGQIYNLAYAEMYNASDYQNYTRIIEFLEYAASRGELSALNALAVLYMNGQLNEVGEWEIPKNLSYSIELLEKASYLDDIDATMNLAHVYLNGVTDEQTGKKQIFSNYSKAISLVEKGIEGESPRAYLMMGELVHFHRFYMPESTIEKYNITSGKRQCEVSVDFYARAILRGYLKSWLTLAQKRYTIKDYEGALLLYSYASMLGLPRGAYAAGYMWENSQSGRFKCKLDHNKKCALYYYLHGIDYYKSLPRIADLIYFKIEVNSELQRYSNEKTAFLLYDKASREDAYSLFSKAQMIQDGRGGTLKNESQALLLYQTLIDQAYSGHYVFEEMYPAILMKWYLKGVIFLRDDLSTYLPGFLSF